jgi:hypothetical protein
VAVNSGLRFLQGSELRLTYWPVRGWGHGWTRMPAGPAHGCTRMEGINASVCIRGYPCLKNPFCSSAAFRKPEFGALERAWALPNPPPRARMKVLAQGGRSWRGARAIHSGRLPRHPPPAVVHAAPECNTCPPGVASCCIRLHRPASAGPPHAAPGCYTRPSGVSPRIIRSHPAYRPSSAFTLALPSHPCGFRQDRYIAPQIDQPPAAPTRNSWRAVLLWARGSVTDP